MRTWFKAYKLPNVPVLEVWTDGPAATEIERQAFQARLNRGDLSEVDVWTDEPFSKPATMYRRGSR